jgi:peptide/nickel transport system substrate-binding protein
VTEVPSVSNGGFSEDFTSITYNLLPGVTWSDGSPFTSADVVFTYEFCLDEATGCSAQPDPNIAGVTAVDDLTVTVDFIEPQPFPFVIFAGYTSPVLSQAQFADCIGAAASGCTEQNFMPMGTGPYMVTELRAEDTVLYTYNPNYRGLAEGKPYFDSVEIKGGGDAEASARSVLEIGEADYGWNLQVAPEILLPMEAAGNGTIVTSFTANVEHINLNGADNRSDEFRSEFLPECIEAGTVGATPFACNENPFFFGNTVLHDALSMAIDRDALVTVGYGPTGSPTCNIWPVGAENSPNNDDVCVYDPAAANAMLDEAGWVDTDGDGIRNHPDTGENLSFGYVTSTNAVRQSNQAIVKENWAAIGVEADMQNEDAGLFFDGTCASDACIWKFFNDIQMYTNGAINSYAAGYLSGWLIRELPTEEKAWGGSNLSRLYSPEFDAAWAEASAMSLDDPAQDAAIHQLNDLIVEWNIIPLIHRGNVSAISR